MSFGTAIAEGGKQIILQDSFTSKSLLLAHTSEGCLQQQTAPTGQQQQQKKTNNINKNPKYSQAKKNTQVDSWVSLDLTTSEYSIGRKRNFLKISLSPTVLTIQGNFSVLA